MTTSHKKSLLEAVADKLVVFLVLALAALCLSGCGTQIVYVPQFTLAAPPDALLLDCEVAPPPDQDNYLTLTAREKEGALTDTLNKNYGFQSVCNITKSELRQWKTDQVRIVGEKNAELRKKAGAK